VTAAVLDAAPCCRTVARYGVGLDNIDTAHANELGMVITNVPDYCLDEVADHAAALILALARNVPAFDAATRRGGWNKDAHPPMHRLRGRTLGLVGYGAIARNLAMKMRGFGIKIAAHSPTISAADGDDETAVANTLEELLEMADVVSVHVPLTEATRGLIDRRALARMRPGAHLVNTSRGAVIDTSALADALLSGHIGGAALDVFPIEPPLRDDVLWTAPNLIVTPHAAYDSVEAVAELRRRAATNVVEVLAGAVPPYVVNPDVLNRPGYLRRTAAQASLQ
jgi:D-3-phosphoglycerate dehydrogenase